MLSTLLFFTVIVFNSLVKADTCAVQHGDDVILNGLCKNIKVDLYKKNSDFYPKFCFTMMSTSNMEVQTKITMKFGKKDYNAQYVGSSIKQFIIINYYNVIYLNSSGCIGRTTVSFGSATFNDPISISNKNDGYILAVEFALQNPLPALRIRFLDALLYKPLKITFEQYNQTFLFRMSLSDMSAIFLCFVVAIFIIYVELRLLMLCFINCDL
ncbi:hypothetical protein M3Y96_00478600 [Aphelenchoides besseyi]|nr:hypothetical protein M3Y96_00478600 [Aphelenchoides besseyi]